MRKKYHFKPPVTKEMLGNGTEIWRNNLTKRLCAFTPNHTIFYDGKDSFWIFGETPIKVRWCNREGKNKVHEFYKGNFCHTLFMENKIIFFDSNDVVIFKISIDKPIRQDKKERIENFFNDNRLSVMFTETEDQISELLSEHFFPYIENTDNIIPNRLEFSVWLN